jgi:uncharacterized membrane protein YkoI
VKTLNRDSKIPGFVMASGLCLGLASFPFASEKSVALKDAPVAVQKAIADRLKGGKLKDLSVEVENGRTEYEAELIVDGREVTLSLEPSGRLLETEAVVDLKTLPEAVRSGLAREAGRGSIAKVEEVTRAGVASYEARVKVAGNKDREVVVGTDGKLIAAGK